MKESPQPSAGAWTTGTYAELRRMAAGALAREHRAHTLAPTELVHEAWLKLRATPLSADPSRLALAARAMRETLVDHARRRGALKRGEGRAPLSLERGEGRVPLALALEDSPAAERDAYVVALDEALRELALHEPELARVVELRFFGGLDEAELARAVALSPRTVKRRWQLAKGWLHERITGR